MYCLSECERCNASAFIECLAKIQSLINTFYPLDTSLSIKAHKNNF